MYNTTPSSLEIVLHIISFIMILRNTNEEGGSNGWGGNQDVESEQKKAYHLLQQLIHVFAVAIHDFICRTEILCL
jgi:hypothetical protein